MYAFLVAHEVAHNERRDGLAARGREALRSILHDGLLKETGAYEDIEKWRIVLDSGSRAEAVGRLGRPDLVAVGDLLDGLQGDSQQATWEAEFAADQRAVQLMQKAGYSAQDALHGLRLLAIIENKLAAVVEDRGTHPPMASRISRLEKLVADSSANS
ncbi:MAG: M48 family metalloprotease [Candidatus Eremiobacterota bacterium]